MISPCRCSETAGRQLAVILGLEAGVGQAEVEFREIPYFVVSRSREKWNPERGDINAVDLEQVTDRGLIFTGDGQAKRSLVPWQNVISITARTEEK